MNDLLDVLTLLNISWQTGPTSGKPRQQVVAELRAQLGMLPPGSFMHAVTDKNVEDCIDYLESTAPANAFRGTPAEPALIRFESGRYFVTPEGLTYMKQLRPLLTSMTQVLSMVVTP